MVNFNTCNISAQVLDMREKIYFISYYVMTPSYFFIGIFGNIVLLIAFKKQSQSDKAYVYQLLSTVSKTLEIFTFTIGIMAAKWYSGLQSEGSPWFMQNYVLMWYTSHVAVPLFNAFITSSLLFSLSMTADRVFALNKPFKYKNLDHRFYHILTAATCFTVGISTSIFDCFRFTIVDNGTAYKIIINDVFVATLAATVLSQLRNVVRIAGLFSLIGLNVAMIVIFRKRLNKVSQLTQNDQRERARKDIDKTLLLLTMWDSLLTCVALLPLICYYISVYIVVRFGDCWGPALVPFVDGALAMAEALDFFAVMAINKKSRRMVIDALPRYTCVKIADQGSVLWSISMKRVAPN